MKQSDEPDCVYGLVDRFTGELCYIGITRHKPSKRLRQHINKATSIVECEKDWWICRHLIRGVKPLVIVLSRPQDPMLEHQLIERGRAMGLPLLNRDFGKKAGDASGDSFYRLHMAVRNRVFPIALYGYSMSQAIHDYLGRN